MVRQARLPSDNMPPQCGGKVLHHDHSQHQARHRHRWPHRRGGLDPRLPGGSRRLQGPARAGGKHHRRCRGCPVQRLPRCCAEHGRSHQRCSPAPQRPALQLQHHEGEGPGVRPGELGSGGRQEEGHRGRAAPHPPLLHRQGCRWWCPPLVGRARQGLTSKSEGVKANYLDPHRITRRGHVCMAPQVLKRVSRK
jgi:hypothetical protein